jgi:APA family basic amino acid/polyamine antiporter
MNTLLQFAIVCLGVLILRYTHPNIKRPFKVPLVPLIPILGIIACIGQMIFLPLGTWIQLIAWFFLGLVVYFTYSIHNSKLHKAKHH